MSKPAHEGEVEGRRERGGGDVAGAAAVAAATVSPVSRLLLAWRAGGNTERDTSREGDTERGWSELCFILTALLWHREPQTRCEEVDLGTGHRSAHPWITSSE